MAVPEQGRLNLVKYRPESGDDHAQNLRQIERWGNDLLLPAAAIDTVVGTTGWFASSLTEVPWAQAGSFSQLTLAWRKLHPWTDVMVDIHVTQYAVTNPCTGYITFGDILSSNIGVTGFSFYPISTYIHEALNVHKPITGLVRVSGLEAGDHLAQVFMTSTDNVAVNGSDSGYMRIMEIVPED